MDEEGERAEMIAAKEAAKYIEKKHRHKKDKKYNLILVSSGDAGPERKMMEILKKNGYHLKNVWLVDVYCPSDEIIRDIKDNYTHYVHCVNFPEMKKILIQSPPSLFEDTYLIGIHFSITYFGLETKLNISKHFFEIHEDPWFWQNDPNAPSGSRRLVKGHSIIDKHYIKNYYREWMTQSGISESLQESMLNPHPGESAAVVQARTIGLIYPLIQNEIGEFFYYWIFWLKKSVAFPWRDGFIFVVSEENLPGSAEISYKEMVDQIMNQMEYLREEYRQKQKEKEERQKLLRHHH